MNAIKLITACASAMLFIAGCGGSSPDAVALDFMKTLQTGKADEDYLKANCTETSRTLLKGVFGEFNDECKRKLEGITFTVVDTRIEEDTATVTIRLTKKVADKSSSEEKKITLKKVDDRWQIDIKNEDFITLLQRAVGKKVTRAIEAIEAISDEEGNETKKAAKDIEVNAIRNLDE